MVHSRTPQWLRAARAANPTFQLARGETPRWVGRLLGQAGRLPPSERGAALRGGRVTLDGVVTSDPLQLVRPAQCLRLDGLIVPHEPETLALAYHKPAGTLVTTRAGKGERTVFDRLAETLDGELLRFQWHAVGRLDRDTTGLLLITNDVRLLAHATRPERHLPKRYVADLRRDALNADLEPLRRGVLLQDGPCRPVEAQLRGPRQVALTLTEGRRHQVRRMLAAVGLAVHALHREAVGAVALDVACGRWRRLTPEEIREGLSFPPGRASGA